MVIEKVKGLMNSVLLSSDGKTLEVEADYGIEIENSRVKVASY